MSAGGGGSGQRSVVSGLRGSGPPLALVAAVLPPPGGGARPSAALYGGGGVGPGARLCRGGRPAAPSPSNPLAPIAWADGARPSPALSLVWGLGLRRRRVPPAVAPVVEGVAQRPGEPVVGIRNRDAEHRPTLQESRPRRLSVRPSGPNHRPEDPLVVLCGRPLPWGHLRFPPSLRRSTASKGRSLIPLVVPEQAQLSHPYTSTTRERTAPPRGSGTVSQSRSQGRAPSAPRASSPCGPCACGAGAAPHPPAAEAVAIRAGSALGAEGAGWCWGPVGWGGMRSPASVSML